MASAELSAMMTEARTAVLHSQALRAELGLLRSQVTTQAHDLHTSVTALLLTMQGANGSSKHSYSQTAVRSLDPADEDRLKLLTPREIEVLRLIGQGERTKEIAFLLGITFKTAVTHRSNIMEKLGIHEGPRLVRFAIRTGICKA